MGEDLVLRELDISKDADKLAEMWRVSNDQWPGTWSGGTEITSEMVNEWHGRAEMTNHYVFETDGKIVAYATLNDRKEEKGVAYVPLLNVTPEYQGRSLGRRLLLKCLERCRELGFRLLTLGTWSGNIKSVPLYKKSGFFWTPDTSVWMVNYLPGILNMACARDYFSKHDWYATFQRELLQTEDDERWEGMKVFTYRWKADGDALTVWADREANRVTAIETDTFFAGAIAENIEPAKGMDTRMKWRLTNKSNDPMQVSLMASGNESVKIDFRKTSTVGGGETVEFEATVEIASDAPDIKDGKPAAVVQTVLILDGTVLELGTGLRPRPAVAVTTYPKHFTLFPDVPKTVHLQLKSHLREDAEATLSLAPSPGLRTDWTQNSVPVPAKGFAGAPVTLEATDGGVYSVHATVYLPGGNTVPERLAVFCLAPGGVLADKAEKETRIENDWTRLVIHHRGGKMALQSTHTNSSLGSFDESIGPPFWPSEFEETEFSISVERSGTSITADMTARSEKYAELTLVREVTVGGGPLVRVHNRLANNGNEAHEVQVQRDLGGLHSDETVITLPLKGGLVQSQASEFPAADEDIDKEPTGFAEKWATFTSRIGTLGMIWEVGVVENEFGWGASFLTPKLSCKPQEWTDAGTLYLYAGPGDWKTVRHHWLRLAGRDGEPEPIPRVHRSVHDARLEPTPIVSVDDTVAATWVVDNLRARPLDGAASLELPDGVSADRESIALTDVSRETPVQEQISLTLPPEPMAYEATLSLETRLFDQSVPAPIVRLGTRSAVGVAEEQAGGQRILVIDNGRSQFTLAPDFAATLIGWNEGGKNHLLSPFPEPKTFSWMSPWYGGIMPRLMAHESGDFPGKFQDEEFAANPVEASDERGIGWKGVRVECEAKNEHLVGLHVELDYLTVGESNVLKLVFRIRNATTAIRPVIAGWLVFLQPDGTSEKSVLRSEHVERKATPWNTYSVAGNWGILANPDTQRTIALVSPFPEVRLLDWGDEGGHLAWMEEPHVPPNGSVERTCYLVVCDTPQEARRYVCLKGVGARRNLSV